MNFLKIFIGSAQSKYAAFAIIIAILAICASILFSNTNISLSQKLTFIFFIIIAISPGILLSLFEITCIVTGSGLKNNNWWCSILAWIIAIVLIIYSIIIVISVLISLFSFNNAIVKLDEKELNEKTNKNVSINEANKIAAEHFTDPLSFEPEKPKGGNMLGDIYEQGKNIIGLGNNKSENFTDPPSSEGGNIMESLLKDGGKMISSGLGGPENFVGPSPQMMMAGQTSPSPQMMMAGQTSPSPQMMME